eukprot:TRINITY_DN2695_c0_g1_i4.p2 TRINITY_DN2695_c0_g1~~TRINITY_DN2695_c0_g1_i4.p2  ORF type:complete len:121 (-),score=44.10 TRINITY_DN2695_c0_g1_i4:833-1195(-)
MSASVACAAASSRKPPSRCLLNASNFTLPKPQSTRPTAPAARLQVVQLATEVCKWNRCREGGREYALDPVAASILSSTGGSGSGSGSGGSGGGSGGVAGMPAGADHMEEVSAQPACLLRA